MHVLKTIYMYNCKRKQGEKYNQIHTGALKARIFGRFSRKKIMLKCTRDLELKTVILSNSLTV